MLYVSTITVKLKTSKSTLAWFEEQSQKAAQLYNLALEQQFSRASRGEKLLSTFDLVSHFRSFDLASDYKDRILERVGQSTNRWIKSEQYRYQLYWINLENAEKNFYKTAKEQSKYGFLNAVEKKIFITQEFRNTVKRLSRKQKLVGRPRKRKSCSLSFSIRKSRQNTIQIKGKKLSIVVPKFSEKQLSGIYNLLPSTSSYQFKLATLKQDSCGTLWLKLTLQENLTPSSPPQTQKEKVLVGIDMGLKTSRVAVAVGEESKTIYETYSPDRTRHFDLGYNALLFASNKDRRHLPFVHRKIVRRRLDNINKEIIKILNMGDKFKFGKPSTAFLMSGRLARSAADAANSLFLTRFAKRAALAGKEAGEVNEAYTSVTCRKCGEQKNMPLAMRIFDCPTCGHYEDRDLNSAYQIAFKDFWKPSFLGNMLKLSL